MSEIRFYFDESVELVVSEQLAIGGFDVVSAHSLGMLGCTDMEHLHRARAMGRVICTYDRDFLRLAKQTSDHAGIVFAPRQQADIGGWVRGLRALAAQTTAEQIAGRVIFLTRK